MSICLFVNLSICKFVNLICQSGVIIQWTDLGVLPLLAFDGLLLLARRLVQHFSAVFRPKITKFVKVLF